jgi:general secretion pathway protein D
MATVIFSSQATVWSQSTAAAEKNRRRDNIIAAEESIQRGDEAYRAHNFEEATSAYRGAFAQVSDGDETQAFRNALRERYAQAAVQAAKVMNRKGDRSGAIEMVDEVLGESVYPDYGPAITMRAKLDDPITTNPSVTPEHAQKVDEVRRLLYQAEGAYNLADFDRASAIYEDVLRIDSTNKAARRGMERVNAAISDYAGAAYDQARASMLSDVQGAWELDVDAVSSREPLVFGSQQAAAQQAIADIDDKLDDIILPRVSFDDVTLEEALEYLGARSIALDSGVSDDKKGIDFVMNMGAGDSPEVSTILNKQFDLQLRNVSLRDVLKYVTAQTSTKYRVDRFAVTISPLSGITNDLIVRQYQVPPTFLTQSADNSDGVSNPFEAEAEGRLTLAPRLTARQMLEQQGVDFPEGASASYLSATNQLTVKTTQTGQDLVQAIVTAVNSGEPRAVIIETRIVEVSQSNLEEIGFDSALTQLAGSGEFIFAGGTTGNGAPSEFTTDPPITSGLRSGDYAVQGNPLFSRIEDDNMGVSPSAGGLSSRQNAPGVLSVIGNVGDYGLEFLFKGLDQKKGVDVMSKPSVITRSGEQAVIRSTRDMIYPTEYEPPELPNSIGVTDIGGISIGSPVSSFPVTPAHPTAFETRGIGTLLEVLPTISADGNLIDLKINPRIDDFLGFINYGTPIRSGGGGFASLLPDGMQPSFGIAARNEILMPIFSSVRASTSVRIQNNRTILIGGLLSENVEKVEDKVPVLGDLPFLGKLFTSDVLQREKRVIMMFVTVRVVDPGGNPVRN